jgi:broad specificity phosphatase PhoE
VDLILVRHGLTDWNEQGRLMGRLDIELNARGHAQVLAVATALRRLPVQAVLSSPQRRTQQTAQAIARLHQLPVRTEPALAEVWLGRWQGMTWNDIKEDPDVARYLADPTHVCDAFEPGTSVHERVVGLVERQRSGAEGSMVLVSHGDPLRILLAHYLSLPLAAYRRLEIAPASVSVLRFGVPFGVRMTLLNWRPQHAEDQLLANTQRAVPSPIA